MTERWLRRDDDFLQFQPYRPIVAAPLIRDRPKSRWSVFRKLTVAVLMGLLITGAIYLTPLLAHEIATAR